MENIVTDAGSLKEQIAKLQRKQDSQMEDLKVAKDKLVHTVSPVQIFKRTAKKFTSGPVAGQSKLDIATGLLAGAITNRLYAPKSAGLFRKATAPFVLMLVTNFVKNKVTKLRTQSEVKKTQTVYTK